MPNPVITKPCAGMPSDILFENNINSCPTLVGTMETPSLDKDLLALQADFNAKLAKRVSTSH